MRPSEGGSSQIQRGPGCHRNRQTTSRQSRATEDCKAGERPNQFLSIKENKAGRSKVGAK